MQFIIMIDPLSFPQTYPVTCHTDYVQKDGTFVAIKGYDKDGLTYIAHALTKGARTIVVDTYAEITDDILAQIDFCQAELVRVDNTRKALAELSREASGYAHKKLRIIGITGTKGKTTTSYLTEHIFKAVGYKTALLSSVSKRIGSTEIKASLTTPQPDFIYTFLNECVKQDVDIVIMEVAAQAVSLYRTHGIEFDGLIFTNFSLEHSEFYATQDDYFQAKKALIDQRKDHAPLIINADDQKVYNLRFNYHKVITIGCDNLNADIKATHIKSSLTSLSATIHAHALSYPCINDALVGQFNTYNILSAFAIAQALGVSGESIVWALKLFKAPRGRLEKYLLSNKALAIIDYAHNPSSFEALFKALRPLTHNMTVVFGAGGGKDHVKRPMMGSIACEYADNIILTTDNPGDEDPDSIINDIKRGISQEYHGNLLSELDRRKAIEMACRMSCENGIVLLLGKGPDEFQIVKGSKTDFSESSILSHL
jgi:UDP-N-acetylmuramoyl-L-alanyl-D-glutamate--2,6-diaminopimelate ligase